MGVGMNKLIATLVVVFAAFGLWIGFSISHDRTYNANLTTEVAPTDATIKIGNKTVRNGLNKVKPGNYKVFFSREGFTSETRQVAVNVKGSSYLGVILSPVGSSYLNWYTTHPNDAKQAEIISGHNFNLGQTVRLEKLPVLKKLPYIAPRFRIDTGISQKYPEDTSKLAFYISVWSDQDKKLALDWLKAQGVNPSDLEIIFRPYKAQY